MLCSASQKRTLPDEVAPAGLDARDEALLRLARRQHLAKDVPVRHGSRGELRYDLLFDGRELRAGGLAGLQAQGQAPGRLFVGRGMPQDLKPPRLPRGGPTVLRG